MKNKANLQLILSVFIMLSLTSCFYGKVPSTDLLTDPYIVTNIIEYADVDNKNLCVYYVKSETNVVGVQSDIMVIDSIGKFNIGNKVYFEIKKKE